MDESRTYNKTTPIAEHQVIKAAYRALALIFRINVASIFLFLASTAVAFTFWDLQFKGWTPCAKEGAVCKFEGTRIIRYGQGDSWHYAVADGSVQCSNKYFGDPKWGVVKVCEVGRETTRNIEGDQVKVAPIFYVFKNTPKNKVPPPHEIRRLVRQLNHAQDHFKDMLGPEAETFKVVDPKIHFGVYTEADIAKFPNEETGKNVDFEHMIVKELFESNGTDRLSESQIFLFIMVRENVNEHKSRWFGGGRSFNGGVNGGGGIVVLELSSFREGFYATLVHELGHSFGLTHTDCLGYSMSNGVSIMSYNQRHITRTLDRGFNAGMLTEEERNTLLLNPRIFPNSANQSQLQERSNHCVLPAMDEFLGKIPRVHGIAYDLLYNDVIVSGFDAIFFTKSQAIRHCEMARKQNPHVRVTCKFAGQEIN